MYTRLLQLPTPLLLLLCNTLLAPTASTQEWPYNLPPHQKYWPEHEQLVRRDGEVRQQLSRHQPGGMHKMSDDPNEMFFLDYWQFDLPSEATTDERSKRAISGSVEEKRARFIQEEDTLLLGNTSTPTSDPFAPLLLHSDTQSPTLAIRHLFPLSKRAFQCPSDTNACISIQRPNSCCPKSSTCLLISDSGIGDVGCCPQGQSCSGSVSSCDTAQGYTSCPNSGNGGCCIPGFQCNGVGCAAGGGTSTTIQGVIVTVTVAPGNTTVTSTSTLSSSFLSASSLPTTTQSSIPPLAPPPAPTTPSTSTVYTTLPPNTATDIVSANSATPSPQGALTCSSGFQTCAPSLNGGCCPTDRVCASGGLCLPSSSSTTSSSSTAPAPPVRPTSEPSTTTGPTFCPTGYYMCSATYIPGCCQVGRNCDTTNCPASTTNTVVSNGATIVVPGAGAPVTEGSIGGGGDVMTTAPAASATTAGPGVCAQGFASCAASDGGGCCPSGYACGQMCTATAGGGGANEVGKAPTLSGVGIVDVGWSRVVAGLMMGVWGVMVL